MSGGYRGYSFEILASMKENSWKIQRGAMAGLIILLGLVAAIMLFRLAINFNNYWLIFIPLVGLALLAIYNLKLLTQLGTFLSGAACSG